MAAQRRLHIRAASAKARKDHSRPSTGATGRVATLRPSMPRLYERWDSGHVWCPAIFTTPVMTGSDLLARALRMHGLKSSFPGPVGSRSTQRTGQWGRPT